MDLTVRHNSTPSQLPELSPVQLQVVQALAQGLSISAAARQAGVHRSTIHNWLKSGSPFTAAFDQARDDYAASLRDQLHELAALALDTIRHSLEDPKTPPSVRLRAALAVLNRPRYPDQTWSLPVPIGTPYEEKTLDNLAILEADYRATRREQAIRKFQVENELSALTPTPRNAPCPCGSGLKYKRCCGPSAPPKLGQPDPSLPSWDSLTRPSH